MNDTATHEWTIVYDASHRSDVEDKLSKKPLVASPLLGRPLKISPSKVEKPTYGTELYNHGSVHADRREIPIQGQKIHTFPYRGLPPGGGATFPCYTFWKALVEPMTLTLPLTVSEVFAAKICDLLARRLAYPQREDCVRDQHAQFHAVRCHRRRDICNRTDTKNYSRFNIGQNAY